MATWLAVRSEWRRMWAPLLAVALVTTVVVGAVLSLWGGARRAESAPDRFAAAVDQPNLQLFSPIQHPTPADIAQLNSDLALLARAAAVDGVQAATAASWWALAPEATLSPGRPVMAFVTGVSAVGSGQYPFLVVDGDLSEADAPDAVAVNETMAAAGFGVGSTVRMRSVATQDVTTWAENDAILPDESYLTGPTIDARVVAVVRTADDIVNAGWEAVALLPGFAAAHGADVAHAEQSVQVRAEPGRRDEVTGGLQALYAPYGLVPADVPDPLAAVRSAVEVDARTLQIAAAVGLVAGLLVLAQVLGRAVGRVALQHPARRAIGMSTHGLAALGLLVVAPALAAGIAAGAVLAVATSGLYPLGTARRAEPAPGIRVEPVPLLAATLAIGLTVALVALLLAWRAATARTFRRQPARPRVVQLLSQPTSLLGASFAIDPLGDARRSSAVAAGTVGSLAVGVAAVLAVATLGSSLGAVRAEPALSGAAGGLVWQSQGTFGESEAVQAALDRSDVTSVTEQLQLDEQELATTVRDQAVVPMAFVSRRGTGVPAVTKGRLPAGPDEVALGPATARRLGASVGDDVVFTDVTGADVALRVVGTVIVWGPDSSDEAFLVTPERLRSSGCGGAALEACNLMANVFVDGDGDAPAALAAVGFTPTPAPSTVARMDRVGRIAGYLAAFLAVLALVALANLLVATLRRRRRDLAVARVLGMTPPRSRLPVRWQAAILGVAGAVLGVGLGMVLGRTIWRVLADDLVVQYRPTVGIGVVIAAPLLAVVLSLLVSLVPSFHAGRLRPVDVLRAE